jgi:mannose-6-phosphate isomerase-like protein (cupin superfamily)
MDWTERVNFSIGEIPLGSGRVELLEWSHVTQFTDNRPHRHTFFEVCLVGAYGEGQFIVQAKPIAVRPGCVFIARPGILHQIVNTGVVPMELFWVCYQLPESLSTAPSGDIDRLLGEFADSKTLVVALPCGRPFRPF